MKPRTIASSRRLVSGKQRSPFIRKEGTKRPGPACYGSSAVSKWQHELLIRERFRFLSGAMLPQAYESRMKVENVESWKDPAPSQRAADGGHDHQNGIAGHSLAEIIRPRRMCWR